MNRQEIKRQNGQIPLAPAISKPDFTYLWSKFKL